MLWTTLYLGGGMKAVMAATCLRCGRKQTKMRSDWTLYVHNNPSTGRQCAGVNPELLFTGVLRAHGLDVRPDAHVTLRSSTLHK